MNNYTEVLKAVVEAINSHPNGWLVEIVSKDASTPGHYPKILSVGFSSQ